MTDELKQKADDLISNLELATGEILLRDKVLTPVVTDMRIKLRALRALLGVERPH
jgi:hypothetical protein